MRITTVQVNTPEDMTAMLSIRRTVFESENHTQQGKFQMHSLARLGFSKSLGSSRKSGGLRVTVG